MWEGLLWKREEGKLSQRSEGGSSKWETLQTILFILEVNPGTAGLLLSTLPLTQLRSLLPPPQMELPRFLQPSYGLPAVRALSPPSPLAQRISLPWRHPLPSCRGSGHSLIQLVNLLLIVAKP